MYCFDLLKTFLVEDQELVGMLEGFKTLYPVISLPVPDLFFLKFSILQSGGQDPYFSKGNPHNPKTWHFSIPQLSEYCNLMHS